MTILVKNKDTLKFGDFVFKCCVGKNGFSKNKIEGDKKTPVGTFALESLYYRKDRKVKPHTNLKIINIKKSMRWCDDIHAGKNYNKLISS